MCARDNTGNPLVHFFSINNFPCFKENTCLPVTTVGILFVIFCSNIIPVLGRTKEVTV
jgi:hypothetical protein